MLTNYYCRREHWMFTTYIIQRNFQATRCTDSSIIPSALRWVLKRQDPHAPPPPTILLCLSAHMSESEHQHLCKCYFSCGLWYRSVWRGGKCRKRKSSAATAYVVLLWIIPYHSGLVWKCVYAFSSIRQLKILRARTIGGPFYTHALFSVIMYAHTLEVLPLPC